MNSRERDSLDRHITGNYGEDQFKKSRKGPKQPRPRRAYLIAEAVSVCCPFCGDIQPAPNGSEYWISEDFIKKNGRHACVSCDAPILIFNDSKANFGDKK